MQTLLRRRPGLACQLDSGNLQMLRGCRFVGAAVLAVHQLLLSEMEFQCVSSALTSTLVQLGRSFRLDPRHSPDRDPGLWERIAAGEVGSPVPHCLTCWDGPESVKAWLQVGGGCWPAGCCAAPAA